MRDQKRKKNPLRVAAMRRVWDEPGYRERVSASMSRSARKRCAHVKRAMQFWVEHHSEKVAS